MCGVPWSILYLQNSLLMYACDELLAVNSIFLGFLAHLILWVINKCVLARAIQKAPTGCSTFSLQLYRICQLDTSLTRLRSQQTRLLAYPHFAERTPPNQHRGTTAPCTWLPLFCTWLRSAAAGVTMWEIALCWSSSGCAGEQRQKVTEALLTMPIF